MGTCLDNEALYAEFSIWLGAAVDAHAPLKCKRVCHHDKQVPWFNEHLREEKCKLRQLERHWRRAYDPETHLAFRMSLKAYKNTLLSTKVAYLDRRITKAKNPQKEILRILKELTYTNSSANEAPSQEDCNALHFS